MKRKGDGRFVLTAALTSTALALVSCLGPAPSNLTDANAAGKAPNGGADGTTSDGAGGASMGRGGAPATDGSAGVSSTEGGSAGAPSMQGGSAGASSMQGGAGGSPPPQWCDDWHDYLFCADFDGDAYESANGSWEHAAIGKATLDLAHPDAAAPSSPNDMRATLPAVDSASDDTNAFAKLAFTGTALGDAAPRRIVADFFFSLAWLDDTATPTIGSGPAIAKLVANAIDGEGQAHLLMYVVSARRHAAATDMIVLASHFTQGAWQDTQSAWLPRPGFIAPGHQHLVLEIKPSATSAVVELRDGDDATNVASVTFATSVASLAVNHVELDFGVGATPVDGDASPEPMLRCDAVAATFDNVLFDYVK